MEGRIADRRAERPALDLPRPERTIREVTEARLREVRKCPAAVSPTHAMAGPGG
jgi:predicted dienelactone hydrolase